jgi:hypothetical protein
MFEIVSPILVCKTRLGKSYFCAKAGAYIVKGMIMQYSQETIKFVKLLVSDYAKYDKLNNSYSVNAEDVQQFDIEEFASLIMRHDPQRACEATGLDNPAYEESMLPALTRFLKDFSSKENQINFLVVWRKGIADYFRNTFNSLLESALEEYNQEHGFVNREVDIWAA